MRFQPAIQNDDLSGIIVTHGDSKLNFNLRKSNGKRSWSDLPNIFSAVNSLFAALSPSEQEDMFSIYQNIYDLTLHKVGGDNFDLLVTDLIEYITGIFDLLPLEGILQWSTNSYDRFAVPETIGDLTTIGNYPASTSYNREEYLELCGLSTAFKLVLPITYEFMKEFKEVFGTAFKEYNMICIFNGLNLAGVRPFEKLLKQAEDKLEVRGEVVVPMGLLLQGIGAAQYPLFSIASDVIRTLCLSETDVRVRNDGVPNNITAKLTKAISKKVELNKSNFSYADTNVPRDNSSGEAGNTSNQEISNTIQRYSDLYGRYLIKEFSRPDFHKRFGIDSKTHGIFSKQVNQYPPTVTEDKMVILGLCFPRFANVESFTLLNKQTMLLVVANAAAFLHQLGLHNLVNFLLARAETDTTTTSLNQYVASEAKPNKELLAKVKPLYEETAGGANDFEEGLKDLVTNICKSHWLKMSPPKLHESYGMNEVWTGDRDLKNHIIMLTISTNTNSPRGHTPTVDGSVNL